MKISATTDRVTATAGGGIGNIGPGLDVLGCAITGPRDEVTVAWQDAPGIMVRTAGHPELPTDPERHTAALAAAAVLRMAALEHDVPSHGLVIDATKRLPLFGGQGGSSASAVAGAVATNALLGHPLDERRLLECCLGAEAVVSGRHLDNIAPSLIGGIVLVRAVGTLDVIRLPVPGGLRFVIAHPAQYLATAASRGVLPENVSLAIAKHHMAQVGAMVAACFLDDLALFARSIDDRIAEPPRSALLPGYVAAKQAALAAGALAVSISGAGPSAFAIVSDDHLADQVGRAMVHAYADAGVDSSFRLATVDIHGASVRAG
jgi:homoserine kinase